MITCIKCKKVNTSDQKAQEIENLIRAVERYSGFKPNVHYVCTQCSILMLRTAIVDIYLEGVSTS